MRMHATLFVTVRPAHGADPCRLSTVYLCADVSGARVRIERHVFNLTKIAGTTHLHGHCLLRGAANPRAVFSSKAVGEPPLFLAASVFWAIKDAIRAARVASGASAIFQLDSPATAERIRLACDDRFLGEVAELPEEGSFKPWAIQV